ncbi:MAG TPA: OmpH family outer membrane protein, partial [Elusimicrobiales bacterium]|nr:OmpH family outer membrane protein [Elusimicrobiales bacterium]
MKRFNRLVLCAALMAVAARCAALELTLEENRGESGSVGYVDIEKVFREYPETQRAKDAFKTELERKEKAILERKKEVFALRGEIARLKLEREFTLQLSSAPLPAPAAKNASRAKKEATAPVVPVSTQTIADSGVTAVVSSDTV